MTISDIPIDLNLLYHPALDGIHRAYVFMRFGTQGVSVADFDDTELPGQFQIEIVPEPMPKPVLSHYVVQFRAWIVGNGLRKLVETYSQFLDQVYAHGLEILPSPEVPSRRWWK